ncbi:MAG: GNAT family N-acetyltransferase [Gemmatimonadetes bacterium]|nr:GNAT family N-acetyltransferase [Gemmatimonadota bacterium]
MTDRNADSGGSVESAAQRLETDRLILREFVLDDAPFILDLLNQPSFLRFIGDKGVRTLEDAREYLRAGPLQSYAANGFGLYMVIEKALAEPIGMCGLLRREGLDAPDIGFAFLPGHESRGYATESARAVLRHAKYGLSIDRVAAVTSLDNDASIRVLEKLGFAFDRLVRLTPDGEELRLFLLTLA